MRKKIVAAVAAAAVGLTVTGFLSTRDSEEEAFRKSAQSAEFCREAAPLDLQKSEELDAHTRQHVIEDLGRKAPDGISEDFDRLTAWYEQPGHGDEEAARQSSYRVGEFIERVCPAINIGGIRS
ncbi:hypothetical protein ACF065_21470 [Streptomyces sp. NPDC015232]|uniref:hypothetical protein n=1 Tax=unclassified Streptomyces TaxID=2593676 RepID=UPI0036FB7985